MSGKETYYECKAGGKDCDAPKFFPHSGSSFTGRFILLDG
jgi:hypothetical protein